MRAYSYCIAVPTVTACLLFVLSVAAQASDAAEFADGKHPATAILQQLIDESAGSAVIPAGTFFLEAPLRIDLSLKGYRAVSGANGATRLIVNHPGPAFEVLGDHQGTAHPDSVTEQTWDKERFPVISDLEIVGRHEQADGIVLVRTMKCVIRNLLIRRCRYGIRLMERNRNVIIADSHFYDGLDTGIFLDACNLHQINIVGNHISYNKRAGIRQFNGDVHNVQITGNDIEYNAGSAESSGEIVLEAPAGIISEYSITGNTLQARPENSGANILVSGSIDDTACAARTMAISGNIIGDRDKNIILAHACRVTISGNTIYGGQSLNMHFQQCDNIVLNGNNIGTRSSMHPDTAPHKDGILLEDCVNGLITSNILSEHRFGSLEYGGALTLLRTRHCRISNCQIINPRIRGVHIDEGMGCVVSDNTIMAPLTDDFVAAVEVSEAGRAHLIQNNWITSAATEPIVIKNGAGISLHNTLVPFDNKISAPE